MVNNYFNLLMSSRKIGINSADSSRKYTGVGVLILTNYNNKPHFVLGREAYKSIKVDGKYCVSVYEEFGGGIQKPSMGLETNACYELKEETSNLFNFSDPSVLTKGINKYFDIPFKSDRIYRIYVVYIENIADVLPYFQHNRLSLLRQSNTYYKYKHYLEMDDLRLIPLDYIKKAIKNKNNYICTYPEDNTYNNLESTTKYIGLLHIHADLFISKRLAQFLNTDYNIDTVCTGLTTNPSSMPTILNTSTDPTMSANIGLNAGGTPGVYTGLEWCYMIFNEGFINCKFYSPDIAKDKLTSISTIYPNPEGSNKLKFLDNTFSIDAC